MRLRTGSMRARTATRLSAKPSSSDLPPAPRMIGSITGSPRAMLSSQTPFWSARRLQRGAHGELIAARLGSGTASTKAAPPRIPIEPEIGVIDGDADVFVVAIDDGAGVRRATGPAPLAACRRAEISARMLADSGRSASIAPSLSRSASRMSLDETLRASMPTARMPSAERPHRRAQHPGPLRIVGLEPEDHAALRRPRQADVDLVEGPPLAVALVVDDQIAVLETEFAQIVAVEAGRAQRRRSRP